MAVVDLEGLMTAIGIWLGFGAILYILIESEEWLPTVKISWLATGGIIFIVYAATNANSPTLSTQTESSIQQTVINAPVTSSTLTPPMQSAIAPVLEQKPKAKTFASLIQYDGPKTKSGIILDAQFVDDGSGSGEGLVNDIANHLLKGSFTTVKPGARDWPKPKILDRATLNKLQILSDKPWVIATFSNADTVLECVYGETRPLGQKKGECRDNYGNRYHVNLLP
jgi:hypothetical protein